MKPLAPVPADWRIDWPGTGPLALPAGLGRLVLRPATGSGMKAALFHASRISVHLRVGGERCRPAGRGHSHSLKKLFQEAGIPPWERGRTPILSAEGRLVAVADLCYDEAFAASGGEAGLELIWDRERH